MYDVHVLGSGLYETLFKEEGFKVVDCIESTTDLVCFTGGTDVDPSLYSSKRNLKTSHSDYQRDKIEQEIFKKCIKLSIPMVGICRGAQFLCVMSGGKLFQHVENHCVSHNMYTTKGDEYVVTSSHHQMMDIRDHKNYKLIGYANGRSPVYEDGWGNIKKKDQPLLEPEVVYFPDTDCLCHQPHPEWMGSNSPYREFFFETLETYLGIK